MSVYQTTPITEADARSGFRCGRHPLDDYFRRHAIANDATGIGRTYVLHRSAEEMTLPPVLGFYSLSMASVSPEQVEPALGKRLPRYPMPVALLGRLAVDERAQGRRIGELLLMDALRRVLDAAGLIGCLGVIVDAKDEGAARFYAKYDFLPLQVDGWPRRMFLSIHRIKAAFKDD